LLQAFYLGDDTEVRVARAHTSAYVSIRQHTSYVSIRQHTSA
jgi:hypothetical protein